ncbi:hypothetical protein H4Q32_016894 [Labeo rohita]|uniref:FRA10AC1 n=1 Tax=Labeo rohita TaxID=84645 RepID=A0ABQ8M7A7_LABRO|nr:hypothetical protein H4Q32_016894 [Labeo rohita]
MEVEGQVKMSCYRSHSRKENTPSWLIKMLLLMNGTGRAFLLSDKKSLTAFCKFERHKKFVSDYILYYGGKIEEFRRSKSKDKTDLDVVRENHRFLWREEDEEDMTWEKELAKKYYDKLFKEYCIADLSRYKENKVCLVFLSLESLTYQNISQSRSRRHTVRGVGSLAEKLPDDALFPQLKSGGSPSKPAGANVSPLICEVKCWPGQGHGKRVAFALSVSLAVSLQLSISHVYVLNYTGQFLCGNKRCENKEGLKSWEVNFAYVEQGEKRNALVKLRLCPECSFKLNYHHKRKEVTVKKRRRSKENVDKSVSKKSKSSRKHKRKDKRKHKKRRKEYSSSSSEESQSSDKDEESGEEEEEGPSESDHWRGPAPTVEEKSREEEFDEYFEDMFL